MASRYRAIATIADSTPLAELDSLRARMGIPRLDSTAVTLVTDTTVCNAAVAAYIAHTGLQNVGDSAVVLALGPTRYLVTHALPFDGESKRRIVVFDITFTTVHFSENW